MDMNEKLIKKIQEELQKRKDEFENNVVLDCDKCKDMLEKYDKYCSRACYYKTRYDVKSWRAEIIIEIMINYFKIEDKILFKKLCNDLLETYY